MKSSGTSNAWLVFTMRYPPRAAQETGFRSKASVKAHEITCSFVALMMKRSFSRFPDAFHNFTFLLKLSILSSFCLFLYFLKYVAVVKLMCQLASP